MIDTGSCIDISGIAVRRKAIGLSTLAAQIMAVLVVGIVISSAMTLVSLISGWNTPLEAFLLLYAGAVWATVRVVRRLRWGDRRVAWAVAVVAVLLLITVLVGLPLQDAGKVTSSMLAGMRGFHQGFGEGMPDAVTGIALLATTPVVFLTADSAVLRKHVRRRLWFWLILIALAIVVFMVIGTTLVALFSVAPPWAWTLVLVDVPLAVVLLPGLVVLLTDRRRVVSGVRLPAAAELAVPASSRRALTIRWNVPATVLQTISVLLALLALLQIGAAINSSPDEQEGLGSVRWAFGLGIAVVAVAIGRAARARAMPSAGELVARDRRPAILYLRSFLDDDLRIRTRRSPRRSLLDNYVSILLRGVFVRMKERFEEVLVWHLWWHGPVISVGDPVRRPYRLGSPRLYLPDERWRNDVQNLMRSARFVVMVLGRTEGLGWELQCLGQLGLAHRLLVVLPPVAEQELRTRTQIFGEIATRAGLPQPPLNAFCDDGLAAVLSPDGRTWRTFSGRHRDEWYYEIAIEAAVESFYSPAPVTPGSAPRTEVERGS
jgi:MFS family permease